MDRRFSIAIMSDLHFSPDERGREDSYVMLSTSSVDKHDPMRDLLKLIEQEKLCADILMCPGDITVAADEASLRGAWSAIQESARALKAPSVFAATGNHDIASRDSGHEPEIWERLKLLSPSYPSPSITELERLRYWADHFLVTMVGNVRVVVLNTCNSHARGEREYVHGRVTDYTIDQIVSRTADDNGVQMNVLLCHHHPMRYADTNQSLGDYSEMTQGPKLLESLTETGQPWLVIHGHKHYPRVGYASGAGETPTIFSAGSLSAVLSPVYFDTAVNQFYLIDIDLDDVVRIGVAGTVRAWSWVKAVGWSPTEPSTVPGRIVSGSGFGYRRNVRELESEIHAILNGAEVITWAQVEKQLPYLKYMVFDDRRALMKRLEASGVQLLGGTALAPSQLLRVPS